MLWKSGRDFSEDPLFLVPSALIGHSGVKFSISLASAPTTSRAGILPDVTRKISLVQHPDRHGINLNASFHVVLLRLGLKTPLCLCTNTSIQPYSIIKHINVNFISTYPPPSRGEGIGGKDEKKVITHRLTLR